MTTRTVVLLGMLSALAGTVLAGENPVTSEGGRDLLRASAPGAYSVRYLPDRAMISSSTQEATELRVYLPTRPLWWYRAGEKQPSGALIWDEAASAVVLSLEVGQHDLQVGWEGTGEQPRQGQRIPLLLDGRSIGELTASFSLAGMTADGSVDLSPGMARVWLDCAKGVEEMDARVSVGNETVDEWRVVRGRLQGRGHIGTSDESTVRLTVDGHGLMASPVERVELETVVRPVEAVRVGEMPEDGVVIEAEDFVGEGGPKVLISEGDHIDQHGGKSIYSYQGDGHWLAWELDVPEAGEYDLFAKIACGDDMSFREVKVDGGLPAPGYALVKLPPTGGWAHAPGEWWYMQIAGGSAELPPLYLGAGMHTLRMEGVLRYHLNIDYFVLRSRGGAGRARLVLR